jgi:hypothetical protein
LTLSLGLVQKWCQDVYSALSIFSLFPNAATQNYPHKFLTHQRYLSILVAGGGIQRLSLEICFSNGPPRDMSTSIKAPKIANKPTGTQHTMAWDSCHEIGVRESEKRTLIQFSRVSKMQIGISTGRSGCGRQEFHGIASIIRYCNGG